MRHGFFLILLVVKNHNTHSNKVTIVNCDFATEYVDIFFDQSCTPFAFVDPPLYGLNAAPLDGVPWNLRELEQPDELRYTQHFVDCFVFHMCWKTGDNGPTVALVLATRAVINCFERG